MHGLGLKIAPLMMIASTRVAYPTREFIGTRLPYGAGTQFTCFTGTKMEVLTPEEQQPARACRMAPVLILLALLVQTCKR